MRCPAASMVVVSTSSGVIAMRALAVFLLLSTAAAALAAESDPGVRTRNFQIERGVALDGYDPVSYFRGAPAKGAAARLLTHLGVVYHFSSDENREAFAADPARYEPAYGGWCAWAMIDGEKVEPDPKTFKIVDGRLLLFYNGLLGDTLAKWNARAAKESDARLLALADAQWASVAK